MIAIRKNKVKKNGNSVTIELPDNFPGEEVDAILWPSNEEAAVSDSMSEADLKKWREDLIKFYSGYSINLKEHPLNREELYDRP